MFTWTAVTKCLTLAGLNSRNVLCPSSGAWKPKIKGLAGPVSSGGYKGRICSGVSPLLVGAHLPCVSPHRLSSIYVCLYADPLLIRPLTYWMRAHPQPHFTLITSVNTLSPSKVSLW